MTTSATLPIPTPERIAAAEAALRDAGVVLVAGHMVNGAGIHLAKTAPVTKVGTFATSGLGASPTWNVFCIDGGIAFTKALGVVGDTRLRIDLDALRILDDGLAWAPTETHDQSGAPLSISPRGTLRRVTAAIEESGYTALVGHELEFVLTSPSGDALPRRGWTPYGLGPVLDVEAFAAEFTTAAAAAGLPIEQLHAEYGVGQLECSLPPRPPLEAADNATLARVLLGRIARKHGLQVSFSPVPFPGTGASGAHVHFSLADDAGSLFSGGAGAHGITSAGGSAIAGVVRALPGLQGVLAGSVLSSARLQPGFWSGAWTCWGAENREAAVRFLEATAGNPQGANVEVKIGDASQNVYYATAGVLASALAGIQDALPLPPEITANPADLDEAQKAAAGVAQLAADQAGALAALESDPLITAAIGADAVEAIVATRRHELAAYGEADLAEVADSFRLAWSV